ncbi:phage protein [Escherichia coli]|uniref:Phage protein n=2 Tax=Enterobacteriaceae TaxID=543 RepID=A0A376WUP1_ECOLX|nr:phage protein [Escherichia coli]
MNRASPADLRKCLETANMLAHSGIRFVPIPAVTDAEFATLSAIFTDKIESLAAEAEMEEISRIINVIPPPSTSQTSTGRTESDPYAPR